MTGAGTSPVVAGWSVARAADRVAMFHALVALSMRYEPHWVRTSHQAGRRITVTFHGPRGLTVSVYLDGDSPQACKGVFILSWHGVKDPHKLARGFAQSVNQFHWHKATDVCTGFDDVLRMLAVRFQSAIDGTAFAA